MLEDEHQAVHDQALLRGQRDIEPEGGQDRFNW